MSNEINHPNKSFLEKFTGKNNNKDSISLYCENFDIDQLKKHKFKVFCENKKNTPIIPQIVEKKPIDNKKIIVKPKPISLNESKKQKIEVSNKKDLNESNAIQVNENQSSFIEVDEPFVIKDNKLSLDEKVLTENIKKFTQPIYQSLAAMSSGMGGGGAVGIVTDDGVKKVQLTRSVNNLIFKGPGVEVTRKGKDVEINISSSINTDVDFPRESTMLSVFSLLNQIDALATQIGQVTIQPNYESIGNTAWINF